MNRDAGVVPHVQRLFEAGSLIGLAEWQLVERFARNRDQAAFEVLVARHGPMVLGVCRRILNDPNDVDDAFQATFLVLVRRAASLGPTDVVAAWLHGVALKVARRARARRDRQARRVLSTEGVDPPCPAPHVADFALRAVIDEEIERLPWKYRAPVALCYLQGLTHEEAARRLEWPIGTVKGRLSRARATLGVRLSRRGITSAAGAGAGSLIFDASIQAAPPEALIAAAARASARIADGRAWDAVVSTSIAELVRGVFAAMFINKLKVVAVLLAMSGVAVTGAGVYGRPQTEGRSDDAAPPSPVFFTKGAPRSVPETDDAEPPPSTADSGTIRALQPRPVDAVDKLQTQLLVDAVRVYQVALEDYRHGRVPAERVYRASRFQLDAQLQAATTPDERTAAYEKHLKRIFSLGEATMHTPVSSAAARTTQDEVRAFQAEAGLWLAKSRKPAENQSARSESAATTEGDGDDRKPSAATESILARLEEPIAMNFPDEQPFEDVLEYIKQATAMGGDKGIPIYIDPDGLQEAEKTMTAPVSLDLDGVPLRRTLQLALAQLGLVYYVDDGVLVITSINDERPSLPPSIAKPLTLSEMRAKAERGEMDLDDMKELIEKLKLVKELKELDADDPREAERSPAVPAAPSAPPHPVSADQFKTSTDQIKALVDQMNELTDALKAARARPQAGSPQ